eukprot:GGOE01007524.1.p2 GENE.GGOE01007524.1~~GGOE01007524.1.p2  ORF type:complete len:108 (-),score=23.22 GGOE01007524.1:250-573(-)
MRLMLTTLFALCGMAAAQDLETWVVTVITVLSAFGLSLVFVATYLLWNRRQWQPARLKSPDDRQRRSRLTEQPPKPEQCEAEEQPSAVEADAPRSSRRSSSVSLPID